MRGLSIGLALGLGLFACGEDGDTHRPSSGTSGAGAAGGAAGVGGTGGPSGGGGASGGGGGAGASGGGGGAGSSGCNSSVGLTQPLPVCSQQDPCTQTPPVRPAAITSASDAPFCKTPSGSEHPMFDDGPPMTSTDASGVSRHACSYLPPGASSSEPRPLVVFFHGSFDSADAVYDHTSLRAKAATFDLSDDPERPGYALISINARNLHWPTSSDQDGAKHDIFHRDLGSPSANPDLAHFDLVVDQVVATGMIDAKRIYTMGWSNGGRFAQLVAIARHSTPTPGGHRVAAAAVYSGTDPFNNTTDSQVPSCQLTPYPTSSVAIGLFGRACDILPCDQAQATDLMGEGAAIEPGSVMATWENDLITKVGATVQRLVIAGTGQVVNQCSGPQLCSQTVALINHVRWPDGVADNSGIDHEPAMLSFLRQHPLP